MIIDNQYLGCALREINYSITFNVLRINEIHNNKSNAEVVEPWLIVMMEK